MFLYIRTPADEVTRGPAKSIGLVSAKLYVRRAARHVATRSFARFTTAKIFGTCVYAAPNWSAIYRHLLRFNRGKDSTIHQSCSWLFSSLFLPSRAVLLAVCALRSSQLPVEFARWKPSPVDT